MKSRFSRFQVVQPGIFACEKSQEEKAPERQSSTKVQHVEVGFLNVADAAKALGVSAMTVTRWCESGKIPAIPKPYGKKTTWQISLQAVEMLLASQRKEETKTKSKKANKSHFEMVPAWEAAMAKGLLTGKVFSPHTIDEYKRRVNHYFSKHKWVSVDALKLELMRIPPHQISKRQHYYIALVSIAKFLIREDALDSLFLEEVKTLFPKRHLPPKRITVCDDELISLIESCSSHSDRLIVTLLFSTGLRASELCSLRVSDIDQAKGVLTVHLGKGNKTRSVGLSSKAMEALEEYLRETPCLKAQGYLFLNPKGGPMSRHGLYKRLQRIGEKAGITVTPHALRRAFVTINANKGRPLPMLQRACGHSDIKTTMSYCMTSENEVIEAMRNWD